MKAAVVVVVVGLPQHDSIVTNGFFFFNNLRQATAPGKCPSENWKELLAHVLHTDATR